MAVQIVSYSYTEATGQQTVTAPLPAGMQYNDLLIFLMADNSNSGFESVQPSLNQYLGGENTDWDNQDTHYLVNKGDLSSSFTLHMHGVGNPMFCVLCIRGADPNVIPVTHPFPPGTGGTHNYHTDVRQGDSINVPWDDALLIGFFGHAKQTFSRQVQFTSASGMTQYMETNHANQELAWEVATEQLGPAGLSGTRTAYVRDMSNNPVTDGSGTVQLVAIKPASTNTGFTGWGIPL